MKKLFMVAIILMVGVSSAMAQKNVIAAGVNVNYGTEIKNVGFGGKLQYGLTDAIRSEVAFNYYLEKDGLGLWDASVNVHYLFDLGEKFKVYPLVGLGYANCKTDWSIGYDYDDEDIESGSVSSGEIMVNVGAGAEYPLTNNLSLGVECKYQIISNFNQLVPTLGLTYKF